MILFRLKNSSVSIFERWHYSRSMTRCSNHMKPLLFGRLPQLSLIFLSHDSSLISSRSFFLTKRLGNHWSFFLTEQRATHSSGFVLQLRWSSQPVIRRLPKVHSVVVLYSAILKETMSAAEIFWKFLRTLECEDGLVRNSTSLGIQFTLKKNQRDDEQMNVAAEMMAQNQTESRAPQ